MFVLLFLLIGAGGIVTWRIIARQGLESTDNAQLEAEIVPVPARLGGTIVEVRFADDDRVEAGQVLARIDDATARAKLVQAEAAVKAAEAQAAAADADARVAATNASGNFDVAQATRLTAETAMSTARQQLREADAAVRSAQAAWVQAQADRARDEELHAAGAVSDAALQASKTKATVAASNLDQAKAHLATLRAQIEQAESRVGEATARVDQVKDVDTLRAQAEARARAAHAQVEVAKAARDVAALDVEHAVIRAPAAGVVSKKMIAVGQMVSPGQAVVQLVTDGLWVTANFKETQLAAMRVGQAVHVAVDAFPDAPLEGHLDSIAGATGARFSLLPPDNATGNYTKVVQRVPARVRLDRVPDGVALRAGMSVSVTVDTRTVPVAGPTAHVD